jgi:phosphonate transport system substrate-binding protein
MSRSRRSVFLLAITISLLVGGYCIMDLFGKQALNRLYTPTTRVSLEKGYKGNIQKTIFVHNPNEPDIRIAIAPIISPERSLPLYKNLINYIGRAVGMQPLLLQKSSYSEVNDLLHYDGCDVGFVCSYPYVLGEREYGLKLLAVPRINGAITMQGIVLVPAASTAQSLLDLRGKRFASCDIISQTGWIYPALWLLNHGEKPKEFFADHIICGSHDRALWAVATQFADGASVQSLVFDRMIKEDPSLADKVRVIMKSGLYGTAPIVVNPRMPATLQEKIRNALITMHESEEGGEILKQMGIERYEVPDARLYDSVRRDAELWNPRP